MSQSNATPTTYHIIDDEAQQVNEWIKLGLRIGVSSALHPFEYAKVLMQIGFEPIAPVPGRTIFGRPAYVLPNIFTYTGYIKNIDGFTGLFRGLSPKLAGMILSSCVSEKVAEHCGLAPIELPKKDEDLTEEERYNLMVRQLSRDVVLHTTGIVVSHPLHVISVRMMAQFVGKEVKYKSIFGSLMTIWREEGILGFFSGLLPRLIADLSCLILATSTTYLVNKHIIAEKEHQVYFGSFNTFIWAGILYPFHLVSTCSIVSGSGLAAGRPPIMPLYDNWSHCYRMLKREGELKRGSSVFFRYAKKVQYTATAPYPTLSRYN
ncbi:mitochondrial carrier homolog 2 [Culicoides brevitarsis]|uniref:mitochondrial carrier homolog 2 n=1 Tax=Culicoides brevitarsis TaxID=469753 RepID=UPI00307BB8CE